MKKLFILASLVLFFAACEKTFLMDSTATISIRPDLSAWDSPQRVKGEDQPAASEYLSPLEIVRQAVGISFQNVALFGNQAADRGFADMQRDTISDPPCLLMYGTDIIRQSGEYTPEFIEGTDCILFRAYNNKRDTIGYIPNSVMRQAEELIKVAYAANDNLEVYRIFNEAFTFLPITGAEWRALKASEQN
jgi:hypothetical protein